MHHSLAVGCVQGIGDLDGDAQHFTTGNRTLDQAFGQRLAFQKFHHQVVTAVVVADVVQRADVGVIETADGLGLAGKTLPDVGAAGHAFGQDLDGDRSVQAWVVGLVDLAHAAGTGLADDFVGAEFLSRFEAH